MQSVKNDKWGFGELVLTPGYHSDKLNVEPALIQRHTGQHQEPVILAMCILSDRQK